jgi:hypothetical protein
MTGGALNLLSDLHSGSVSAGLPPTEWCKEIVYMIPKEAGVDVIEKQRPLELQESLKKAPAGIRTDRMARAWERLGRQSVCLSSGAVHYSTSDDQKVAAT